MRIAVTGSSGKLGTVASIMSYGRFNYVAQPEDKVRNYLPKLGPYDIFAIEWGYRPIARARTPEDERTTLDAWASRQLKEPWLRFGGEDGPATVDPTVLTENISSDVFEATAPGLKNLDRVIDKLTPVEAEVGNDRGLWFLRRILPYRTAENRIEGVVVTYTDITALKLAAQKLESRERQQAVVVALDAPPPGQTALFNQWEDAVECAKCGGRMVRTGSCYTCRDCGTNTGCS